jgi:hypothetical protein
MDKLIDNIKEALGDNATPEQKAAAAQACRALLVAFETKPGEPLAASAPAPPPASPVALLGKLTPDQALDLLIGRLRAAVPDAPKAGPARGFKVQLVPVPKK